MDGKWICPSFKIGFCECEFCEEDKKTTINNKKIIKIFWKIVSKSPVNLWIVIVGSKEQDSKKRRRKLSSLLIRFAVTKENAFIWQIHLFIYYHYYRRYHHLLFSSSRKFTSDILVVYILWCRNKIFKFWGKHLWKRCKKWMVIRLCNLFSIRSSHSRLLPVVGFRKRLPVISIEDHLSVSMILLFSFCAVLGVFNM